MAHACARQQHCHVVDRQTLAPASYTASCLLYRACCCFSAYSTCLGVTLYVYTLLAWCSSWSVVAPTAVRSSNRPWLYATSVFAADVCFVDVQQSATSSSNSSSNGTLPGVLPGERLVVTSTGLQTNGTSTVNLTGQSAFDRLSSIESNAMGSNLTNPYQRLIR